MKQEEILLYTLERLNKLRIPYFITGSVAVSVYGKPQFTHDRELQHTSLKRSYLEQWSKDLSLTPLFHKLPLQT